MPAAQRPIQDIFTDHVDTVYRVCYALMGNAQDAEDATQETFVKLVRAGRSFENSEHERAWLIRVASNHCKDVLKSAARRKSAPLEAAGNPAAKTEGFDDTLDVVLSLEPPKYRDVVYLYYYEGYSTEEIASILAYSPSTVRNLLSEARSMLRRKLGGSWS